MDDPRLDPRDHERALAGLHRLNALSRAPAMLLGAIRHRLSPAEFRQPLRVLDLACGDGRSIARLRCLCPPGWSFLGADISPFAIGCANGRGIPGAEFRALDILQEPLPKADVVLCTNFLHHCGDDEALILLKKAAAAAAFLIVVLDLERSWLSYWQVALAARLVTDSEVVHVDSALSIRSAFKSCEIKDLAERAELPEALLERRFPCRLLLTSRLRLA